ncbi:MAG: acetyl-CoA carboxylase, carboxyltransferase subunit beta [Nitrospinota bacterium]|nr:acetyl-CoA carboxylase, carboxyltransferase subunit beta [Nitrospinota bacterium]
MSWFTSGKAPLDKGSSKRGVPEGVFVKCEDCGDMIYSADFEDGFRVCKKCGKHHPISAAKRIELLIDKGTFKEYDENLQSTDPLKFKDTKKYKERVKIAEKVSGVKEAIVCGTGRMNGWLVEMSVFEFGFLAGSMGSVVGEKIARSVERAVENRSPLITVSCSGGARMQEGTFSLMQMAKTSSGMAILHEAGLPFISVITHPTTGGVTASFAMLGDVIIAEPKALICFAGPRVIEQTIRQKLPEGFQTSEFLLEHGFLDLILNRSELKGTITNLIRHMSAAIPPENRGE